MTIAFGLATALVAVVERRLPVVGAFTRVQDSRSEYLALGPSPRDAILLLLSYVATVFVVLLPQYTASGQRLNAFLALGGFAAIVDFNLSIGGRAGIVFTLISMGACYLIVYRPNLGAHVRGLAAVALVVVVLGGPFVLSRNQDFARQPNLYLAYNCVDAEFANLIDEGGSNTIRALAFSSCYFSSPVHTFDMMLEEWDRDPLMGGYNTARIDPRTFVETRAEIARFLDRRDLAPNPWAGAVRDFWLDLGAWAPIGFAYLGIAIAALTPRSVIRSELELARMALICLVGFMVPFISPLVIPQIVYPLGATVALAILGRRSVPPLVGQRSRSQISHQGLGTR